MKAERESDIGINISFVRGQRRMFIYLFISFVSTRDRQSEGEIGAEEKLDLER